MSLTPPQTVVISGCPHSQVTFNDELVLKTVDYKIGGFKISLQQNKIVGISFLYQKLTEGRGFFCNDKILKQNGTQVYEFYLEKDDFIQVIFGCYTSTQITQFGVVTYKGKQGIFGTDEGYKYKYLFLGFSFTLAFGTFKNNTFEMLGFKTQKLPREAVMKYVSPLFDILYSNTILTTQQQNDYLNVEIKLPTTQQAIYTQQNIQSETDYSTIQNQQNNLKNFNTLRTVENIALTCAVVEEIQKPNKRYYTQSRINNNTLNHNHVRGHGILGFLGSHLFGRSQDGSGNHHHHRVRLHHHHHHHGGHHGGGHHR